MAPIWIVILSRYPQVLRTNRFHNFFKFSLSKIPIFPMLVDHFPCMKTISRLQLINEILHQIDLRPIRRLSSVNFQDPLNLVKILSNTICDLILMKG
jgi:hypothetical protein